MNKSKTLKRVRNQVGDRIRHDYNPPPSTPKTTVSCPMCGLGSDLSFWKGDTVRIPEVAPIVVRWKLRYPRKPDGGRGFSWEEISEEDAVFMDPYLDGLPEELTELVTRRMIEWVHQWGRVDGRPVDCWFNYKVA